MAVCHECRQEMLEASTCTVDTYPFSDGPLKRIPYGSERPRWKHEPCHDCGVKFGGFHHPGCDVERCPRCEEQALSCGCSYESDDRELGLVDVAVAIEITGRIIRESIEEHRNDPLFIDGVGPCGHVGFCSGATLSMPRGDEFDPELLFQFGGGTHNAAVLFICRTEQFVEVDDADIEIARKLHEHAQTHDVCPWELAFMTRNGSFLASDLLGLPGLPTQWEVCPWQADLDEAERSSSMS